MRRRFALLPLIALLSWGVAELALSDVLGWGMAEARRGGSDDGGSDDGGGDDRGNDDGSDSDKDRDADDDRDDDSGGKGRGRGRGRGGADTKDDPASAGTPLGSGKEFRTKLRRVLGGEQTRRLLKDGSEERLIGGRYQHLDRGGRLIEDRAATTADRRRLGQLDRGAVAALIEVRGDGVMVTDPGGWREELRAGRYRLTDPRGNLVVDRVAGSADLERIRQSLTGQR